MNHGLLASGWLAFDWNAFFLFWCNKCVTEIVIKLLITSADTVNLNASVLLSSSVLLLFAGLFLQVHAYGLKKMAIRNKMTFTIYHMLLYFHPITWSNSWLKQHDMINNPDYFQRSTNPFGSLCDQDVFLSLWNGLFQTSCRLLVIVISLLACSRQDNFHILFFSVTKIDTSR